MTAGARLVTAASVLLTPAVCSAPPRAAPSAAVRPLRVMSINLCTDQLVLMLLPRERIASVSWLARDPGGSLMAAAAAGVRVNHGLAEEVVRDRPDLVIAGSFTTPATRALLRRLGTDLVEVEPAGSTADIRRVTRQVAAAVGEPARGEALIARMDGILSRLARSRPAATRVAAWDGAGVGAPAGSLYAEMLDRAGAANVVAGSADIEQLLAARPPVLVQSALRPAPDLQDARARHPAVRTAWRGRTVQVRAAYHVCGTPLVADGIAALRRDLLAHAPRARTAS